MLNGSMPCGCLDPEQLTGDVPLGPAFLLPSSGVLQVFLSPLCALGLNHMVGVFTTKQRKGRRARVFPSGGAVVSGRGCSCYCLPYMLRHFG